MKLDTTTVARHQLLDYVTRREFNDFKDDMFKFKEDMFEFKGEMYEFRVQTGAILDQMRSDMQTNREFFLYQLDRKVDQE